MSPGRETQGEEQGTADQGRWTGTSGAELDDDDDDDDDERAAGESGHIMGSDAGCRYGRLRTEGG